MTTAIDRDVKDVAAQLVLVGLTWCDRLPHEYPDSSTRGRVEGAEFSILTTIDGASLNIDPVCLSPKSYPRDDLGGQALHEQYRNPEVLGNNERQFVARLRELVDKHADQPGPIRTVMGGFLLDVCRMLAEHYWLRLLNVDDNGEVLSERADVAAALPTVFADMWARN